MTDPRFLSRFAWPVGIEHQAFVDFNFFDRGATFHSDVHAHGAWREPAYTLQVWASQGVASQNAASANAKLPAVCGLHDWKSGDKSPRAVRVTNGDIVRLLETGDIKSFLAAAGSA